MNVKKATNSQLSTTESEKKRKEKKNPLGKQPEQEENHRNGDQMEISWRSHYQPGGGGKRLGEKVQGIRSIIGNHKIDRRRKKEEKKN